jgi:hypothetical protein
VNIKRTEFFLTTIITTTLTFIFPVFSFFAPRGRARLEPCFNLFSHGAVVLLYEVV